MEKNSKQKDRDAAVRLGRKGGLKRFEQLTPEQRTTLGRRAAQARWGKKRKRRKEE